METAIIFAELYRHESEWKFNAVGNGLEGDLRPCAGISEFKSSGGAAAEVLSLESILRHPGRGPAWPTRQDMRKKCHPVGVGWVRGYLGLVRALKATISLPSRAEYVGLHGRLFHLRGRHALRGNKYRGDWRVAAFRSVVMIGLAMRTDVRKHRTLPTIAPSSPISRMHIGIE